MSTEKETPWRNGFKARMRGDGHASNPYPAGSANAERWLDGWQDQDEHLSGRDDAASALFTANKGA